MGDFIVGFVTATFLLFFFAVVPFMTPNNVWQRWAIENDAALYCPTTGNFAWKGECDNE